MAIREGHKVSSFQRAAAVSLRLIEKRTLRERIVERLKVFIMESGLQAGDRLPTEREMAERLGVSRTAVREAMCQARRVRLHRHSGKSQMERSNSNSVVSNVRVRVRVR